MLGDAPRTEERPETVLLCCSGKRAENVTGARVTSGARACPSLCGSVLRRCIIAHASFYPQPPRVLASEPSLLFSPKWYADICTMLHGADLVCYTRCGADITYFVNPQEALGLGGAECFFVGFLLGEPWPSFVPVSDASLFSSFRSILSREQRRD